MHKTGPIIIIEDDHDDQLIFGEAFNKLPFRNEVIFFDDGYKAFEYLTQANVKPFLIISDINMPKLNGFVLRDMIHENEQLRFKCTPYLFFTTSTLDKTVTEAYSKSIQGFFIKPNSILDLELMIKHVVEYWRDCRAPSLQPL